MHTVRRMTTPQFDTQATFGELLRRWRRAQRLTQRDFGALLTPVVEPATVSCWENDARCPSVKFLGQILTLTQIPAHIALGMGGPEGSEP